MVDFSTYDGSGRCPREVQQKALDFLKANWDVADVFVLRLPTGAGKSFIARTVMRAVKSVGVMTPSNQLLTQYLKDYPEVNAYAGKKHYLTAKMHDDAKMRALGGSNTFFNVASYLTLRSDDNFIKPQVMVIDEADAVINYFENASGFKIPTKLGGETLHEVRKNLEKEVARLERCIARKPESKVASEHATKIEKYKEHITDFKVQESDYTLVKEGEEGGIISYRVKPVVLPTNFTKKVFEGQKLILMSGSIFEHDVRSLLGENLRTLYYDAPSPIVKERRQVYIKPVPEGTMQYPVNYSEVAKTLRWVLSTFPVLRPAIVHCTYSDMRELRLMFTEDEAIFHDKHDKQQAIEKWQQERNKVLFACGMSTGVDLKNDMCRLNIILKALYPSQNDVGVRKRLSKLDGGLWADLTVLRNFIQSCGRSTRNERDYSATVVLDSRLAREVERYFKVLPSYFKESLNFRHLSDQIDAINNSFFSLTHQNR